MQCPSCHNEVGIQSTFCNHCGASLAAAVPEAAPSQVYNPPPPSGPGTTPSQVYNPPPPSGPGTNPSGVYNPPPPSAGPPVSAAAGLSENAASAIAYLTIIPAILFLVLEPYNKQPLVRFHSFQSIGLNVVAIALQFGILFMQIFMHFIPLSWMLFSLLHLVVFFALFVGWLLAILKASKGEWYKLPVIGDFAEKQARS